MRLSRCCESNCSLEWCRLVRVALHVDVLINGQFARDETDLRLEATRHNGGDRGSHFSDGSYDPSVEKREHDETAATTT